MGVCCTVFDIDGMLFDFFYEFFKYWKNKFNIFFLLQNFHVFFVFLISRVMLVSTLKKNIEKCPFGYWLNGRWFIQLVDRDSWNLYPLYPLFPCSDFVSQMWGWFGGGGVMFFSYFMLFTTFLYKINWQYIYYIFFLRKNNYFSFNVFFMFCYAGNIEKCPFTYC